MDRNFLTNTWLRVRWQTERLGAAGKIGLGLFVFSAVFFVVAVLPQQAASRVLMMRAEAIEQRLKAEPVQGNRRAPKIQGDQGLQAFYAFFPKMDSSPFWIKELVQVAAQRDVEITRMDYRMVYERDVKLARYEMILPVRGKYAQVRGFIADALRVVPAMALADVTLKRQDAASELLDVNLKFNLYLGGGGT
ncbi:hypothetical protein [Nitrosovibrio sp. Nv4]|uniref:hypothetical protein n=1 Tax=Nitrosovibrio sp. Nv4 TaxID=1945880 RepID=UPI000BCCC0C5|nr:hypothetical protein [Nitrosovibrio sp. Nv4]SOD40474.1 hypothetical protein SAMN06298226_0744 [Nitrosovibrio sp. Nv4]